MTGHGEGSARPFSSVAFRLHRHLACLPSPSCCLPPGYGTLHLVSLAEVLILESVNCVTCQLPYGGLSVEREVADSRLSLIFIPAAEPSQPQDPSCLQVGGINQWLVEQPR